jgi:hypothetical protein
MVGVIIKGRRFHQHIINALVQLCRGSEWLEKDSNGAALLNSKSTVRLLDTAASRNAIAVHNGAKNEGVCEAVGRQANQTAKEKAAMHPATLITL